MNISNEIINIVKSVSIENGKVLLSAYTNMIVFNEEPNIEEGTPLYYMWTLILKEHDKQTSISEKRKQAQVNSVKSRIANKLQNDNLQTENICKPIAKELQTNCKSVANQLQTNCKPIANQLQNDDLQIIEEKTCNINDLETENDENLRESNLVHYINSKSKSNSNSNSNSNSGKKVRSVFVKPTIEEIQAYVVEKGYDLDAEYFYNHYESNGWLVGKNKMKNWKSAIVTWIKRNNDYDRGTAEPGRTKTIFKKKEKYDSPHDDMNTERVEEFFSRDRYAKILAQREKERLEKEEQEQHLQ